MFTQSNGVGIGDLQQAALAEARRFMREAKGDRDVATVLVLDRLVELTWITGAERDVIAKMYELGRVAGPPGAGKVPATAYAQVQELYHGLIGDGRTGQVGLVLAAGAAGSFRTEVAADGTTTTFAAAARSYQGILGGAGAIIGGALGGAPGAAIGGAIGGVIGTIVDDCKD